MKYTTRRPRARWCEDLEEEVPDISPITVYEPDDEAQPTGLYDVHGDELFRVEERQPIGFRVKERSE